MMNKNALKNTKVKTILLIVSLFIVVSLIIVFSIKIARNKKISYSEAREMYGDECIMITACEGLDGGITQEDELTATHFRITYAGHVESFCSYYESGVRKKVEYDLTYEQTERLYELACELDWKNPLRNYDGFAWHMRLCKDGAFCQVPLPTSNKKANESRDILWNGRLVACEAAGIEDDERNYLIGKNKAYITYVMEAFWH